MTSGLHDLSDRAEDLAGLSPETMDGAALAQALPIVMGLFRSCDAICDRAQALLADNPAAIPGWRLDDQNGEPVLVPIS